jgi:hypothetical protein
MATHAPHRNPTRTAPLFSRPTPGPGPSEIPNWHQLETDLRQALLVLLAQMIGNHLPSSGPRDGRGVADDPR